MLQNLVAARPQWALAHYELARTLSMLGAVTKRSPRCANRALIRFIRACTLSASGAHEQANAANGSASSILCHHTGPQPAEPGTSRSVTVDEQQTVVARLQDICLISKHAA